MASREDLADLTVLQLKVRLSALGMIQSGNKDTLVDRLWDAMNPLDDEYDSDDEDWNDADIDAIKDELQRRGLRRNGGRGALLARLRADHDRRKALDDGDTDIITITDGGDTNTTDGGGSPPPGRCPCRCGCPECTCGNSDNGTDTGTDPGDGPDTDDGGDGEGGGRGPGVKKTKRKPACCGTSPPPCSGTSPPPCSGTAQPACSGTAQPACSGTAQPACSGTAQPACSGTTQPACSGTAQPACSGTAQPACSGTAQPACSGTAQPTSSGASGQNPDQGGVAGPVPDLLPLLPLLARGHDQNGGNSTAISDGIATARKRRADEAGLGDGSSTSSESPRPIKSTRRRRRLP